MHSNRSILYLKDKKLIKEMLFSYLNKRTELQWGEQYHKSKQSVEILKLLFIETHVNISIRVWCPRVNVHLKYTC